MASSQSFAYTVLCWLVSLSTGLNAVHHREHKVHNIVLYPDKHSWCKITTIKQVISYPGCVAAEIENNVCVGACFSYSIPHTKPSDPGEVIVPYCDSCQPSATTWHQITLKCDDIKSDTPPLLVKNVQIIQNCSCTACDDRYGAKVNKITYNIINGNAVDGELEPDVDQYDAAGSANVANELMILQSKHVANQRQHNKSNGETLDDGNWADDANSSSATVAFSSEVGRMKRMHDVLNQKVVELLDEVQRHNRHADIEQLLDLLHVAQHAMGSAFGNVSGRIRQQMDNVMRILEGERELTTHDIHLIREFLRKLYKTNDNGGDRDEDEVYSVVDNVDGGDQSVESEDNMELHIQQYFSHGLNRVPEPNRESRNENGKKWESGEDTAADDYQLPIWMHDMNEASANNQQKPQPHMIEITNIVEKNSHLQPRHHPQHHHHQQHLRPNHEQSPHHAEDNQHVPEAVTQVKGPGVRAHSRHHHSHHIHPHIPIHTNPHSHPQYADEDSPESALSLHMELPRSMSSLVSDEEDAVEQLNIHAHELKPNHAGTLLSYHNHMDPAASEEEPVENHDTA